MKSALAKYDDLKNKLINNKCSKDTFLHRKYFIGIVGSCGATFISTYQYRKANPSKELYCSCT